MKKVIAIASLLLMIASIAFAEGTNQAIAGGAAITGDSATAGNLGKLSTNVSLTVTYNDVAFSAGTKHLSGNRGFATSSADTRIYYKEIAPGLTATEIQFSQSNSVGSGWTSL